MRNIILTTLCLLPFTIFAQYIPFPLTPEKSTYIVNEKAEIKTSSQFLLQNDKKILIGKVEYGSKGLPIVFYEYDETAEESEKPNYTTYYKYNAQGYLSAEDVVVSDGDNYKTYYTYNKEGRLIRKESVEIDPPTTQYVYDKKGKLISASVSKKMPSYNKEGEFTGKSFEQPDGRYEYESNLAGQIIEEKYYRAISETPKIPNYINTYIYNKTGLLTKFTFFDTDSKTTFTRNFIYNDKGLLIKSTAINDQGGQMIYIYEYCNDCKQSWIE